MKTFPLPPFPRSLLPCTSRDAPCLCQGWRRPPARQCSTLHEIQPAIPCRAESMRPSWTKKTDPLTHSSALAGRGNDPSCRLQGVRLILLGIRGLDVAESRGQQAPDLPALRRLPVPPMYPTKRRRRSRGREGICNSCSSALPLSDLEWAPLSLHPYISQLG
jgi:hypothetical protein